MTQAATKTRGGMLKRSICAVFGHRYIIERVLNRGARKVGCTRCLAKWAMHDETRSFLPWDEEFEEMYATGGILAEGVDAVMAKGDTQC